MPDEPADDFSKPSRGSLRRTLMWWLPALVGFAAYIGWHVLQGWQERRAPTAKERPSDYGEPSTPVPSEALQEKYAAIDAQIEAAYPKEGGSAEMPTFPEDGTNIVVEVRSRVAGLPGWRLKLGTQGWDVPAKGAMPEDVRAALTAAVRERADGPEPVRAEIRATERQPPHGLIMEVLDLFLSEHITSVTFGTQDTDGTNFKPRDRVPAEAPPVEGPAADHPPEGAVPR